MLANVDSHILVGIKILPIHKHSQNLVRSDVWDNFDTTIGTSAYQLFFSSLLWFQLEDNFFWNYILQHDNPNIIWVYKCVCVKMMC